MSNAPPTVLLVEDNLDHAGLVMRSLEEHEIATDIQHVTNGEAALDYLFQRRDYADPETSPRPSVILLDLRLPKIDGQDVLKQIKATEQLQEIPVVILTTSEAEKDIAQAYAHHGNSYLVKPVDFQKFAQLMQDLGLYWLGWNHCP